MNSSAARQGTLRVAPRHPAGDPAGLEDLLAGAPGPCLGLPAAHPDTREGIPGSLHPDEEQLSPSRNSYSVDTTDVELHNSAVCLEWSEVLEGVLRYADSGMAAFSSREVCNDLLSFVEEVHANRTPYRTSFVAQSKVPIRATTGLAGAL